MKAFNKVSKITALIISFWSMAFLPTVFSQTLNPPQNLSYTIDNYNDVTLLWDQPATGDSATIHWDNGINYTTWGFLLNGETYSCAVKWDPEHITNFNGWKIKRMRVFLANYGGATMKLKIWSGPDATEIYSQDIENSVVNDWNEIVLDEPVFVDASTQLWAGVYIEAPFPAAIIGMDQGPVINNYGNLFFWNGSWQTQGAGNWNIQLVLEQPSEPTYLHWDSGNNNGNFFGFFLSGSYQFSCAAKWNPEHIAEYDGWNITSIRFFLSDANVNSVKIKLWTGPAGVEVYSQDVTDYNINDWTEITLDTPYPIDASTNLWGGVYIDMPNPGAPIGLDEGPLVQGQGFWLYYQGQWYDAASAGASDNMNVQLQVQPPDKSGDKGLLGYNIYRNSELINPEPVAPTVYIDENLYNGTYSYYVTAVYDEGESDPSDPIIVVIDAPVVLAQDSLALVDLYNSCGGTNWNNSDEWLSGPISEWWGVTVTETRVTQLWLQMDGLSGDLPESLGDLTGLHKLHIESNEITSIPESIGNLEVLTEFWIGWNPITEIPESIGNLSNLQQLHIGFSNLGELPETFGNLTNLTWLGAGDAGLNSLPDSFGNLVSLESCFIWGNNLTELPENIGGCVSMQYFHVEDNQLTTLPESIGNMTDLIQLKIENNQITSLPESFGNLESLVYLYGYNNQLAGLPESFGNLSSLSHMWMSNNLLTGLPDSFGNLSSLDSCYLSYNQLQSLSDNFGDLDDLNLMDFSHNQISALPDSFGDMATIEEIYLDVNELTELPASLSTLSTLQYGSFAVNQITSIPEDIGTMTSLNTLNLNQNQITTVPESLGDMTGLYALGLSFNLIDSLPDSFGNLETPVLMLNGNNLKNLPEGLLDNSYEYLYIYENALQFGSIEPLLGNVENFEYNPQDMLGTDTVLSVPYDTELSYTIEVSGQYNIYKWYKDGELLPDQTTGTLHINPVTYEDMGTYVLKVTNTLVTDMILISHNIVLDVTTNIDEEQVSEFRIYPNPATSGTLTISFDDPDSIDNITVFNSSGQLMLRENNISKRVQLDIGNLVEGLYIVKLSRTDGQTTTKKVVVK